MKKRRFATLIEMLIAIVLLSILLTTLFSWYRHLTLQKGEINKTKWPILEERYVDQRLNYLFTRLQDEQPFFTTDDDHSLVFLFDNSPHPEPELAKTVLARLYHDSKEQTLCLGIWPHPSTNKKEPYEKQVLLDNVSELTFDFYNPPPFPPKQVDPPEVGYTNPRRGSQNNWRKNYRTRPAMIMISVTREKEEEKTELLQFALDLPTSVNTIRLEK